MRISVRGLGLALSLVGFAVHAASLQERLEPCLACHGEKGQSESPDVPSLGAQPVNATLIQLYLFREKRRSNHVMNETTKGMTDTDLQTISQFLVNLPPPNPPTHEPDAARMSKGAVISRKNHCGFCHNADYSGRDNIPRLAAQQEEYLVKAMREYKSGDRKGYDAQMAEVLHSMTDRDIQDVAYFIAHSPAEASKKRRILGCGVWAWIRTSSLYCYRPGLAGNQRNR